MIRNAFRTRKPGAPGLPVRAAAAGALCLLLTLAACATIGREFPASRVSEIQIGRTTRAEIREMFGEPWRTGIDDGLRTWTYGRYRYSAFSDTRTQDLVIRFAPDGVVKSYTFNTTDGER